MKTYLIFLAQSHPNFRKAELESLADLHNIKVDLSNHDERHPFMTVQLENDNEAINLINRSILAKGIYELWGHGDTIEKMHLDVKCNYETLRVPYMQTSFKFDIIPYQGGKKTREQQIAMIEQCTYLAFKGPIKMKNPDETFAIFENYLLGEDLKPLEMPDHCWFARQVQLSARSRGIIEKYEIRKRPYYGTTTFDAELSLVTCNMAQVIPKTIVYDPFVGTGSFLVGAAEFGAWTMGNDIDFRTLKGKGKGKSLKDNFKYYKTPLQFIDTLCMDFTNNAIRSNLTLDTIISDPPYGVREGLKVCGVANPEKYVGRENIVIEGELAFLRKDYIQPKKPYSLDLILDNLLEFAATRLPVNGRLCFWMPVANDEDIPTLIPQHENLEMVHELVQEFSRWSRRLLVYVKRDENYKGQTITKEERTGSNNFRVRYFNSFSKASKDLPEDTKLG
ncbi:tRNA (guanine-N2-)-methyltransferase [Martiniozyma asiatica (nom. inval.)]|nr:tRNA (guanine-N2-)-methyltransferase [Martiniozyma asiatica]